jgi:two-component system nitrogen regulation response regulator GlnG
MSASAKPSALAVTVADHLRAYFAANDDAQVGLYDEILQEVERPLLQMTLQRCRGNQIKAAAMLGINRNTLRKKLRDYGIAARGESSV